MAVHAARLGFARNLFQAGGFHVVVGPPEDLARHARSPACARPTRSTRPRRSTALRDAGARHVWLAGRGDYGADGYVHTGCDALAVLRTTADLLEVPR